MKNLELQKCILGPVYTNCYLLKNKETGELIIVDPADCPEKIEMKISRMNGKPVAILLTHGHFDHILHAAPEGQVALARQTFAHFDLHLLDRRAVFDQIADRVGLGAVVQVLGKLLDHGAVEHPHVLGFFTVRKRLPMTMSLPSSSAASIGAIYSGLC